MNILLESNESEKKRKRSLILKYLHTLKVLENLTIETKHKLHNLCKKYNVTVDTVFNVVIDWGELRQENGGEL